jgi:nucleotide-binding universal stress UspA family protein
MIDTILVATDGSEQATKAVDLGGDLASRYGARVEVVHVLLPAHSEVVARLARNEEPGRAGGAEKDWGLSAASQGVLDAGQGPNGEEEAAVPFRIRQAVAERVLAAAELSLREQGVREIATVVLDGDPARAILERAREAGADMIVMGNRGLGDLKGLVMGSVSHKVASLAPCTCVTVT